MRKTFLSSLIVGLLLSAGQWAAAETPVAIVSISGVENVLKDVSTLANIAGMGAEAAPLAMIGAQAQAFGLDTKKPWGAVLYLGEAAPRGMAFVPVSNFQQLLNMAKTFKLPVQDNGNGTYSLTGPAGNTAVIKEQNGWMFVAQSADDLANLPADPTTLLAGLDKQYTIAIRANLQSVPAPLRDQLVALIKAGAQGGMRRIPDEEETQFMFRQKMVEAQIAQIGTLINETEQFTFGWAVDGTAKKTSLDFNMTAVAGSNLAKQFAKAKDLKSDFTGFLNPAAAGNFHFTGKLEAADIQQLSQALVEVREKAMKGVDNDANIPNDEGKKVVKDIVNQLLDVAKATIESGKIDGGAVLNLASKNLTFAAGAYVADGAGIESALKKLVEIAKNEPDFPGVNFNVATHQGVRFHTTSLPNPDPQAQQVFGDKIDVAIGIGDKSVYLAIGKDSVQTLKDIIDKSASGTSQTVLPAEFALSLGQLLNFISQFDSNPMLAGVSAEVSKANGQDHVRVQSKSVENGATGHVELEEGVIRAIGAAAKMGIAGGAGGAPRPGFAPPPNPQRTF